MFCPNCGANNSTEQKFCRQCGLNLEKSAESLLEQLPTAQSATVLRREKLLENFGNFALGGLCVVGFIGIVALVRFLIKNILIPGNVNFTYILLAAFFVFAVLSLVYVIANEWLKEKKGKLSQPREPELNGNVTTGKLLEEKPFVPAAAAASVTENSTELLLTKNDTRKFE